ncbi:recombinase family protein [Actinocrispum wychmicini]|uniref:Recombinase n=1 Tax=Actinocrispum wychmicini TaxID=1213861 RepID=A0A4R2J0I3_9PSEU|nr:recombinase family protein [Actinocrispum wychmicini]TCO49689.1 recombinase [Actinocrispum wychmicini]
MTTRLHCRACGWHPTFRRKRTALRAAARHHCTGTPLAETTPRWWTRLWTTLWTRPRDTAPTTTGGHPMVDNAHRDTDLGAARGVELAGARGTRIRWAVLAAHHAETTRRSRHAMIDIVRAGYQIGPPPYGYRALRIRVTHPTGHSTLRTVLVPHWQTAAVVTRIFTWRADDHLTFTAIARRLNNDPRLYPPRGPTGRWTATAVRRVITFSALQGTA